MMSLSAFRRLATAAALVILPLASHAAEPVLAQNGSIVVDTLDVRGDALRIPPEIRQNALTDPNAVAQIASNLLMRRTLAAEAEASGMEKDPAVQAAIRIARDRVLSDLVLARMDAGVRPNAQVLEGLAQNAYKANPKRFEAPDETRASHILVARDKPDAKAKAEKLLAQLKAGAKFEDLARAESDDPGSAQRGGDLGFFGKGRMVPAFDAAVEALKNKGELSGIVETQFGYHIIRLEERRPTGVRPYDEVKEALKQEAEQQIMNESRQAKVVQLQKDMKFNNENVEAFARSNRPSVVRQP